ncbi:hypothetical protein HNO92_002204 [Chromobacterium alkanivorans]|uniref:hypothetical protein n=1 Tax=Chromobacterium alkanivorans TaxID=1071719 RepID=UPI00216A0EA3|nr:hypothetical protein [Chromobacterium alkanivorans]MCS3805059.1 hypothetical protein [Chromobacterium alkanivorans]MCS3819378.1 hypothetical protein [Chromobacterium alkanivorans]MCS3873890.1 hypothetical protein [Chromobacterium alkanivorans]
MHSSEKNLKNQGLRFSRTLQTYSTMKPLANRERLFHSRSFKAAPSPKPRFETAPPTALPIQIGPPPCSLSLA